MKNKGAKTKIKRKGAFGCDLTEHLESSGQDGKCRPPLCPSQGGHHCIVLLWGTGLQEGVNGGGTSDSN